MIATVLSTFYFRKYYELIVFGFIIDMLYNPDVLSLAYIFTISSIIVFILIEFLKTKLRGYE